MYDWRLLCVSVRKQKLHFSMVYNTTLLPSHIHAIHFTRIIKLTHLNLFFFLFPTFCFFREYISVLSFFFPQYTISSHYIFFLKLRRHHSHLNRLYIYCWYKRYSRTWDDDDVLNFITRIIVPHIHTTCHAIPAYNIGTIVCNIIYSVRTL